MELSRFRRAFALLWIVGLIAASELPSTPSLAGEVDSQSTGCANLKPAAAFQPEAIENNDDSLTIRGTFPNLGDQVADNNLDFEFKRYEDGGVFFTVGMKELAIVDYQIGLWGTLPVPDFQIVAEIVHFFERYSDCRLSSGARSEQEYFSEYGAAWMCADGDPFLVSESAAAGVCAGAEGNLERFFPMELVDIRELSDGRFAVLIAENTTGIEGAHDFGWEVTASIWIFAPWKHGTVVDAVVGNIPAGYEHWLDIEPSSDG